MLINVKVQLKEQSQSMSFLEVINTYQKGSLYCIYMNTGLVHKFPIESIFSITEEYGVHTQEKDVE